MAKLMAAHCLCHTSHPVPLNNACWISNHIIDFLLAKMVKQNLPYWALDYLATALFWPNTCLRCGNCVDCVIGKKDGLA